jgi:hypothetical protein
MTAPSVNTSGKDFDSIVSSLIDFASIQYGEAASVTRVWSDFNISSFSRNWAELVAYCSDQLMFYMDTQANQSYLRSATIPSFVVDIANQLGYEIPTQQSSAGKVQLTFSGPASVPIYYPVFAGTTQFITTRSVTASQAGSIEVDAIQGVRFTESFVADGIQNEAFTLIETDIIRDLTNPNPELRSPIITVNGTTYNVVRTLVDSAPNSTDVLSKELPDGRTRLIFGDGIFGRRLVENESVNITYRNQGGTIGNVQSGEINTLGTAITNLIGVNNNTPFNGGVDRLTLQQIKDRVPLSLKTIAGAVSLPDFSNILIANYPQVLNSNAAINTVQSGIDLDVYVLPNATSVTNITDNSVLFNTLTDYLERRKVVGTTFLIKNAQSVQMLLSIETHLNSDASRSAVEADIRAKVATLFNLQTGGFDGQGVGFAELVRVSDLFEVLRGINGLARFDIKVHTIIPRIETQVSSATQNFYTSKVETYTGVSDNEWLIATSEIANPEPANGQVSYKVFKRTLGKVTSLTQDSVVDTSLDLTRQSGSGVVSNFTTLTDSSAVFIPGQYDNFLLVDANSNIWRIASTHSSSLVLTSPALNNGSITSLPSGNYRVVDSFSDDVIGLNNASFTIIYNTHNAFYSPGASFDLIATIKTPFILSKEQSTVGTYGVPVSIATATPIGNNPGDLVGITFNSNPNLGNVDATFILADSNGESFEINAVSNDTVSVAEYNNPALITSSIILTDTGNDQTISVEFNSERDVVSSFLEVTMSIEKTGNPIGSIFVEIRADDGSGNPGSLIQASNLILTNVLSIGLATISFNFPSVISLSMGSLYHLTVRSDTVYKASYSNLNGSIRVGIDTSTLGYSPATTASGFLRLDSVGLAVESTATGTIKVSNNFIRTTKQATLWVILTDNASFTTGTNKLTLQGQPFLAVAGTPGPGEFQVGANLTNTRDNLLAAINAQMTGIVQGTSQGTDSFQLVADATNYKGEAGNTITVEVVDQGIQNINVGGLSKMAGGISGDNITIVAPQFLNTGLVGYTYNSPSGVLTFNSVVSLPTFKSGDTFIDGAGKQFPIISINTGLNTVTIAISQIVDNSTKDSSSGSINRVFVYTFGENVAVGATVNDTAINLAAVIDPQPYLTAISASDTITITSGINGINGNKIQMSKADGGQSNFILSGSTLLGGSSGDIVAINGFNFIPVLGTPSANGQFQIDIGSLNNTLANLEHSINIHPSLVGVVVALANTLAKDVQISSSVIGASGNLITLAILNNSSGKITISGSTLVGGVDNKRVKSYNGVSWSNRSPDSDMIFFIGVAANKVVIVSKISPTGTQVLPVISIGGNFDASLGKRYYSDKGEVSFVIATRSPNSLILGGDNVNVFGRGTNSGALIRVDQFVFRTSNSDNDVTNLRPNEIPVLTNSNLRVNLLGGVA